MERLGYVTAILGLLAVYACARAPSVGVDAMPIIASPGNAALDAAYRSGDADAATALMSDSVIIAAEGIPDLVGRAAVRDILRQFFVGNRVAAFTLRPAEFRVYGDQAFERGTFVWSAGPKDGTVTTRNGRYMLLRVREGDGAWRVHRYIENCLPAPCP